MNKVFCFFMLVFLASCSRDAVDSEEYAMAYDEGYYDGYDDACRKFKQNLSSSQYEASKPRYCR